MKNAEGQRRLDQPNDYVRIEIESALKRDIRVIPVLVDGARMPAGKELPDSIKPLSRRNAVTLSHQRFGPEVDELAGALRRALGLQSMTYAFATTETPTFSWINFLFSFEGRISRKQYWLSQLVFMVVALLFTLPVSGNTTAMIFGKTMCFNPSNTSSILLLPMYWPTFAVFSKRLHDIGQGRALLWLFVFVTVLAEGLDFAGYAQAEGVLVMVCLVIVIIVGTIKGTPGPNQYGPDPLASPKIRLRG